jgi:hypothetical protein
MPFTQNWFEETKEPWIKYVVPALAGKSKLRFIEVGSMPIGLTPKAT